MAATGFIGEVTRAHDYRTFFANTFSLQFGGADLLIKFAITKDVANPQTGVEEQCTVAMSSISAKALMLTMKTIIEQVELLGQAIPLAPEVAELLNKVVEDAKRK